MKVQVNPDVHYYVFVTPRLTEDEMSSWRVNFVSWQLIENLLDRQLQRDAGMPYTYYAILLALSQRTNGHSFAAMAHELDFSQSRMSHAVTRLEKSGLVQRRPDPNDGRAIILMLTTEGRRALVRASAGHVAEVRRVFFAHLDERDLADIRRIGVKLLKGNDPSASG